MSSLANSKFFLFSTKDSNLASIRLAISSSCAAKLLSTESITSSLSFSIFCFLLYSTQLPFLPGDTPKPLSILFSSIVFTVFWIALLPAGGIGPLGSFSKSIPLVLSAFFSISIYTFLLYAPCPSLTNTSCKALSNATNIFLFRGTLCAFLAALKVL